MKNILSFDIGGSKLVAGIVDETGEIKLREKYLWDRLDESSVLNVITSAGRNMLDRFAGNVSAIGAAIPGLCNPDKGIWVESSFSGLSNIPIQDILNHEFSLPVAIENDVNACALAEKMFGCCKDSTDFIWLTVSNGCGGALFLSNALYKGFGGTAGEIGHIVVEENNGFQCGCGNSGCLEIQAAGPGIVRRYLQKTPGESLTAADIASKAREGDANALKVYRDEGKYLGYAIASAVNLLNPERVIIGGGVSASFDLFADTLRETVMQRIYQSANKTLIIETSALGYNASLIGAASLALV